MGVFRHVLKVGKMRKMDRFEKLPIAEVSGNDSRHGAVGILGDNYLAQMDEDFRANETRLLNV